MSDDEAEHTTMEVDGHDGRVYLTIGETRMEFSAATARVIGDALIGAADQALKITTESVR